MAERRRNGRQDGPRRHRVSSREAIDRVRRELPELLGRPVESVLGLERDDESVLAWAREPWVCTVMNLHVDHTPDAIAKAADDFRRLIDRAIEFGGSYFLTYHRWANRNQVEACHPRMVEFLRVKRRHDPAEVFQSDWYRHYKRMFADRL